MAIKLGINGLGRIGRNVFRAAIDRDDVEIVAMNMTSDPQTIAYLLTYDSIHGVLDSEIQATENSIIVKGKEIKLVSDRDPARLPWGDLGVDIVIESTGKFNHREGAAKHIEGGAKKVIITAPAKNEDCTIVVGVNDHIYDPANHHVISNASCTTNCLAPVAKVISQRFGIIQGLMTTVHAFTNDQNILDDEHKDLRRARALGISIIPTTTGAAKAVSLVLPELEGKLNGFALRVPVPNVSVVDLTVELERPASKEEINAALREAAEGELKGILGYCDEPLVSGDFLGDPRSSIVDALSTMCTKKNTMAKIVAWYDNEWGYSCRVLDLAAKIGRDL
ncbi:type I glyceraldehyde-3-phosphate dehydrogenase [Heliophilum fasciatum]|uniref:Glyceraldehyde-3-phosphate dehydrogenase n=1 Tax=Heliophilum fasciatum TaxID=35700 RepID=A0A4R2RC95_9FIRM|nr:type I glyceraldehyde-3-phosphate dehydrogenase [Heliophilum fasciatum]MCW2279203.1 glyceraldehyde 3-phosphate dehydrogenase [Heliophilum fasciatum]TCP60992.1 glyceraldehyde-3-phosphate dehydrogenase (NAD+) [Heliophilum fasciatum]